MDSKLLAVEVLLTGNALSFSDQPYLEDLFKCLTAKIHDPVALVLGAGVSMDAGLVSWSKLLDEMSDQIPDAEIAAMAKADASDPMRKAEYIRELVSKSTVKGSLEIIRDALFQGAEKTPGQLADAVARLVATDAGRFRILTTNFDEIIEKALTGFLPARAIRSVGISPLTDDDEGVLDVVHLHGLIAANDRKPIEPIVLTESEFLKHGPGVREYLKEVLKTHVTVFIGVSLTDPNLIGPLWDLEDEGSDHEAYVLVVPGLEAGAESLRASYAYSVRKSTYLDERLGAKPIFLKSYSQLVQVVSELALASIEPENYRRRPLNGAPTTRYGKRFSRALSNAYTNIGCPARRDLPDQIQADNLSENLYNALHGPAGPVAVIKTIRRRLVRQGLLADSEGAEHFGLFLWLRTREHASLPAKYSIHLVGSSVYSHREHWSLERAEVISPLSKFLASQAIYRGTSQMTNLSPSMATNVWNGAFATPITIYGFGSAATLPGFPGSYLDQLTVGAVTLNTTKPVVMPADGPLSILARLSEIDELGSVADAMQRVVAEILFAET